jgi:hypothetical protein
MIFNEDIAFLHVPKMGGMSITNYLLNNLPGKIHLVVPEESFDHVERAFQFDDVRARLRLHAGVRHERWDDAQSILSRLGFSFPQFKKVLAVIRNPYTLELSYFQHLRKPSTQKMRLRGGKEAGIDTQIAICGDFRRFCHEAPFYGRLPSGIEKYYSPDGRTFSSNLRLIRFEFLEEDLVRELEGFSLCRATLAHANASGGNAAKYPPVDMSFDTGSEAAVFDKFRFLFHFYERSVSGTVVSRELVQPLGSLTLSDDDRAKYVRTLYSAVLHREPKQGELEHWVKLLSNDLDLIDLPVRLIKSKEFELIGRRPKGGTEVDIAFVEALYMEMLNREPKESELKRWLNALAGGFDPRRLPEHIRKTSEYISLRHRCESSPDEDVEFPNKDKN